MATEHSLLRGAIDSINEAHRLLERFDRKDVNYVFTKDDCHTIRGAATMASQGAKAIAECSGFIEARVFGDTK